MKFLILYGIISNNISIKCFQSEPQFPDYDQQHKLGSNAACTSINTEIDSGGISPASSESGIDLSPLIYLEV